MRILLIEDDASLTAVVKESLYKAGFEVDAVGEGAEALSILKHQSYDALILDLGLPDIDGMLVLERLRSQKNTVPILILTARDTLPAKVAGLNSGADDYMVKPFEAEELIARTKALLRRPATSFGTIVTLNNLSFDTIGRHAFVEEEILDLSRREIDLLEQLMATPGKIVPKKTIEQRMYSYGEAGSPNSVEVLAHRLRKKLVSHNAKVEIHTLKGSGYMIVGFKDGEEPA